MRKRYLAVTRSRRSRWRVLYAGRSGDTLVDVVDGANKLVLDILIGVGIHPPSLEAAQDMNNNLVIAAETLVKAQSRHSITLSV